MSISSSLLAINAVKLSPNAPFTWASGTLSPIYCDNRITLSYPDVRTVIRDGFVNKIKQLYPHAEAIAGVATGGIAHGALVAEALHLPFIYIRDKPKQHGRQNIIEGYVPPATKVVVIEDLISTGGSSLKAVEALREYGVEVLGLLAIFTYNFQKSIDLFESAKCPMDTLTGFKEMIGELETSELYTQAEINYMKDWYSKQ